MSYDEISFWQKSPTKACPMVWTHQSGRKSLLLGATADYVIGLPVDESRALLELLDAPFDDRGARGDDALRALRAALSTTEPAYHGEYYSFSGLTVDPCALQPHVPFWIGGRTQRSLRRALTLADGWSPFGMSVATAGEWLRARDVPAEFEVVLAADSPLDPVGDPERTAATLRAMENAGTTIVSSRFIHRSFEHYLGQIHALAELHDPTGGQ